MLLLELVLSFLLRFYVKDAGVCRKTCILLFCYLLYIINRNFILLCSLLYLVYHISISYRPVNFVQVLCKKDSGVCVGKLVSVESDF